MPFIYLAVKEVIRSAQPDNNSENIQATVEEASVENLQSTQLYGHQRISKFE